MSQGRCGGWGVACWAQGVAEIRDQEPRDWLENGWKVGTLFQVYKAACGDFYLLIKRGPDKQYCIKKPII